MDGVYAQLTHCFPSICSEGGGWFRMRSASSEEGWEMMPIGGADEPTQAAPLRGRSCTCPSLFKNETFIDCLWLIIPIIGVELLAVFLGFYLDYYLTAMILMLAGPMLALTAVMIVRPLTEELCAFIRGPQNSEWWRDSTPSERAGTVALLVGEAVALALWVIAGEVYPALSVAIGVPVLLWAIGLGKLIYERGCSAVCRELAGDAQPDSEDLV